MALTVIDRLNQIVGDYSATPTNLRPDGLASHDPDINTTFALGFCEVKKKAAEKKYYDTHLDTFRLGMFCKNAIDKGDVGCTLGVQAVGRLTSQTL